MVVVEFNCKVCGNKDVSKVYEYDGALGYEALVCKVCGTYYDENGSHKADDWSKVFAQKISCCKMIKVKAHERTRQLSVGDVKHFDFMTVEIIYLTDDKSEADVEFVKGTIRDKYRDEIRKTGVLRVWTEDLY